MKFNPLDHHGHNVHGDETIHYSGTLTTHGNNWWVGDNRSGEGQSVTVIQGCYDCDVEFDEETGATA